MMFVKSRKSIADCGLRHPGDTRDSSTPQSPAPNPRPRRGLSLTEVLIAMGILTLGLLGVASVFPVGSFYMQKADNYDISSSLAQEAMNELETRGWLDPWAWFTVVPQPASGGDGTT